MASKSPSRSWTASVSTVETAQGTHSFRIDRYSLLRKASVDKCFYSGVFTVGGHDWRICYIPDGGDVTDTDKKYDAVFLKLADAGAEVDDGQIIELADEVRASYEFRMVNPVTGVSYSRKDSSLADVFNCKTLCTGFYRFVSKHERDNKYLQDDSLVIECDVMVIKGLQLKQEARPVTVTSDSDIHVPPSDLSHDLRRLLESEEEADVTFKVKEEAFRAHKIVLAMRSPVFKAELYGPMSGGRHKGTTASSETESITVEGMDPAVFKALLHFIYTDTFPPMDDDLDVEDDEEQHQDMVKHLLVAADRYGMERLKSMCESILCKSFDAETVAYTLALAGQHHCVKLKSSCIEFIVSSNLMDVVLASQGYQLLKRACPDVAVELWENNSAKSPVTRSSCIIRGQLRK